MRVLFATLLLFVSCASLGQDFASSRPASAFASEIPAAQFLPVEQAYQLSIELTPQQSILLHWQIADTYYLYKHRFNFTLTDAEGEIPLVVEFPPALERSDEYFGEVSVYYQYIDISASPGRPVNQARLTVDSQGCADAGLCYPPQTQYYELDFQKLTVTAGSAEPIIAAEAFTAPVAAGFGTILYMLLLAFAGGSILNLMPCVFPVLSLKMLSFARSADQPQHAHSWIYALGVVSSFVAVAAILIMLQRAGEAIGWGFHLQSPTFVIAMAYLFAAMALSLSGLVNLGSSIMGTGSELANKDGLAGSFFTGVLAVIVASPCTAPFMGTALGFAVTQTPATALLIFAALGAGMAAPMVMLNYSTRLRAVMPKPGPWMETLKQFLAFPLYATAIWLVWVAGRQTGVNTMAVALLGTLFIALGLWLWRYRGWRKWLACGCILTAVACAVWRGPDLPTTERNAANHQVNWSERGLNELRSAGKAVFVDVTADWCISCIANEQAVLNTEEIRAAFSDRNITYMVADWTNYNADIAAYLQQYGRNGIPFYILYSEDPKVAPNILPQILTKSLVLNAIKDL